MLLQPVRPWCTLLLMMAAFRCDVSGQVGPRLFDLEALHASESRPPDLLAAAGEWPFLVHRAVQSSGRHTRTLAGLGVGVTAGGVVMSLDAVVGSGCIGSGDYLGICQLSYVAGAVLIGGVGALAGRFVRTEQPPGRGTQVAVGSALGAVGAFALSTAACRQGDGSNPGFLCGHDGHVSTRSTAVGAVLGGALGAVIEGESGSLRVDHLGAVRSPGSQRGLGAAFTWRPD